MPSDGFDPLGAGFGLRVALDGDNAFIAGYGYLPSGSFTRAVYVFRREGSQWIERQKLFATSGGSLIGVGPAVAIDGAVSVIGHALPGTGAAYVFRFNPVTLLWAQEQELVASNGAPGDMFGAAVAIEGDTAIVGAPGDNHRLADEGSAYVFRFDSRSSSWLQTQKLIASDREIFDQFGEALALWGDTAIIGAPAEGAGGSAYVFRVNPRTSQWSEVQKLVPPDAWAGAFADAVAIDGNRAIFGAWASTPYTSNDVGAAYVYGYDAKASQWVQDGSPLLPPPTGEFFGWSVALDGDTALIGSYGETQQAGAAYVYTFDPAPADLNCDGLVNGIDLGIMLGQWSGTGVYAPCPPNIHADLNADCRIDGLDLGSLLGTWSTATRR